MKKILALSLTLVSAQSLAQDAPTAPPTLQQINQMFFMEFDADHDQQVSRDEFLRSTNAQFDFMDRNRDGMIDKSEVAAYVDYMTQGPQGQE
jgi:Ca2+-binding EF-hand superfamily protein